MAEWNNIANGNHDSKESQKPCLKHAAENLSEISKPDSNCDAALCNDCSKTMLSYISLIQDRLDSLARKLSQNVDPSSCIQCQKQESHQKDNSPLLENVKNNYLKNEHPVNSNEISNVEHESSSSASTISVPTEEIQANQTHEKDIHSTATTTSEITTERKRPKKVSSRRNCRRISREMKENGSNIYSENSVCRNGWQTDFLYNVSSSIELKYTPYKHEEENISSITVYSSPITPNSTLMFGRLSDSTIADSEKSTEHSNFNKPITDVSSSIYSSIAENCSNYHRSDSSDFTKLDYSVTESSSNDTEVDDSAKSDYSVSGGNSDNFETDLDDSMKYDFSGTESNLGNFEVDLDDSLKSDYSGIESSEREVEDIAMKPTRIENTLHESMKNMHDSFNGLVTVKDKKSLEAFVTLCRNNAEALGCLVLGSSLLLSRTSRKLCVLVFDDVDPVFMEPLSSIFHAVQHVRDLKSVDERYLKEMNLEKLNIWNLVQFSKCVFLNPDCLILRNCDEMFDQEELSAVPDIGWPDCFNAGVFVFAPSVETLSKLVEHSQRQGQNNAGDQMLLNSYFNTWSSDIGKKLSFIYNLMRNASYTYGPAFQRFGHNVKIVQFLGGSKPWEVKFSTETGQLDGDVDVHPKHVRFFSEWINTFNIAVMKLFPQDVYSYAFNQKSISAEDIGFALCSAAPRNSFSENTGKPFRILPKRRSVFPFHLTTASPRKVAESNTFTPTSEQPFNIDSTGEVSQKTVISKTYEAQNGQTKNEIVFSESPINKCLPGASIGDYQGMKAWEQGLMDYEGYDSSENIMNRLSFLIRQSL